MTSGREPVGVNSQGARVDFQESDDPQSMGRKINDAFALFRDDIQRLAALAGNGATITLSSGNYRLPSTMAGVARVWAISDTATTGSGAGDYHTLTLTRNGITVGSLTYDTRRTEVAAYGVGCYLGEVPVGVRDVLAVSVAVTGAPAPTLSSDNFCLLSIVREG